MDALSAMLNVFVDPKATVDKIVGKKFAWIFPVLIMGVILIAVSLISGPISMRVLLQNPPEGANVEQMRQSLPMIQMVQKITAFFTPIIIAVMLVISAGLTMAACAVLDIKAKFGDVMNLLSHCSLISFVQVAAGGLIVYMRRDDIQSMAELQPAFGLNLFLPEGSSRVLYGFLGYFSIFTIWYIVVLGIAFAYMTKTSNGKGFAATAPVWILGLLFAVVGSLFQPK